MVKVINNIMNAFFLACDLHDILMHDWSCVLTKKLEYIVRDHLPRLTQVLNHGKGLSILSFT